MGAPIVLCTFCKQVALCIFCILLASCATTKPPLSDPRSIWCEQNSPRRDAELDTPIAEIREINTHNAKGETWCHWRVEG